MWKWIVFFSTLLQPATRFMVLDVPRGSEPIKCSLIYASRSSTPLSSPHRYWQIDPPIGSCVGVSFLVFVVVMFLVKSHEANNIVGNSEQSLPLSIRGKCKKGSCGSDWTNTFVGSFSRKAAACSWVRDIVRRQAGCRANCMLLVAVDNHVAKRWDMSGHCPCANSYYRISGRVMVFESHASSRSRHCSGSASKIHRWFSAEKEAEAFVCCWHCLDNLGVLQFPITFGFCNSHFAIWYFHFLVPKHWYHVN